MASYDEYTGAEKDTMNKNDRVPLCHAVNSACRFVHLSNTGLSCNEQVIIIYLV